VYPVISTQDDFTVHFSITIGDQAYPNQQKTFN